MVKPAEAYPNTETPTKPTKIHQKYVLVEAGAMLCLVGLKVYAFFARAQGSRG